MPLPSFIRETGDGVALHIKVQPRAKKNEIVGVQGDELRIKISAPPVDSAANVELVKFLAKTIGCSKPSVSIQRGQTSRHKILLIRGISVEEILGNLVLQD